MKKLNLMIIIPIALAVGICPLILHGVYAYSEAGVAPIVGVWFVKTPEAPFKYHMFVFNSDGTMQQANPDAGDPNTSDSDGMGVWTKEGSKVKGKFVEVTADRSTRTYVSRGEISFEIQVSGDSFSGPATARFYDVDNKMIRSPISASLAGTRVTLP